MIFGLLRESLAKLRTKAPSPTGVAAAKDELQNKLLLQGVDFAQKAGPNNENMIFQQVSAHKELAVILYDAFAMCTMVPANVPQEIESYQKWTEQNTALQGRKLEFKNQIDEKNYAPSGTLGSFVMNLLWPFVLVLALSLKFAKGIGGIRPRSRDQ